MYLALTSRKHWRTWYPLGSFTIKARSMSFSFWKP